MKDKKKSDSESQLSSLPSHQEFSSGQPQSADDSKKAHLHDVALLRMRSWQSKINSRRTLGKTEMVPVGERGDRLGQYHHRAVYTDDEIECVFSLYDSGMTVSEIARKMEMPRSTVWAVCKGLLRGKTPSAWRRKNV